MSFWIITAEQIESYVNDWGKGQPDRDSRLTTSPDHGDDRVAVRCRTDWLAIEGIRSITRIRTEPHAHSIFS